jgi:hypothetical protein
MPTNVTAKQLGDRPAYPCALPFEHTDRCGMSTRMAIILRVLPALLARNNTTLAGAYDNASALADLVLEQEARR